MDVCRSYGDLAVTVTGGSVFRPTLVYRKVLRNKSSVLSVRVFFFFLILDHRRPRSKTNRRAAAITKTFNLFSFEIFVNIKLPLLIHAFRLREEKTTAFRFVSRKRYRVHVTAVTRVSCFTRFRNTNPNYAFRYRRDQNASGKNFLRVQTKIRFPYYGPYRVIWNQSDN